MKVRVVESPRHHLGEPVQRFNQKFTVLSRTAWDPQFQRLKREYRKTRTTRARGENVAEEYALRDASSYIANTLGTFAGFMHGDDGLYSWRSLQTPEGGLDSRLRAPQKVRGDDPAAVSARIREVGRAFGADLIGITTLNNTWLYSHSYNRQTGHSRPVKLPPRCKFVIVMAIEMDYRALGGTDIKASAATGLGYSKMAFTSSLTAQFIRNLGYTAFPCGNDTALSIPLAVDAGLGELGRNGLLITPQLGSRVRICKVITDLPLQQDKPIDFGVQKYCEGCQRCLKKCPAHAISKERTTSAISISTNPGLLKWPVDGEECFRYWCKVGVDCSICIRVCPFSKRRHERSRR